MRKVSKAVIDLATEIGAGRALMKDGAQARERQLFEAWMRGHCWACGEYDPVAECYRDMTTRILWAAWRDRALLGRMRKRGSKT